MRDKVTYKKCPDHLCKDGVRRTVYVRGFSAPFAGWIADADTAFSVPAYVTVKGRRVAGYVTPSDGMAFQQDHAENEFRPLNSHEPLLGGVRVERRIRRAPFDQAPLYIGVERRAK